MNPETAAEVAAEKKGVRMTSEIPQAERLQERADGSVPASLESRKAARARGSDFFSSIQRPVMGREDYG